MSSYEWISASAGTGKTYSLIQRIKTLIEGGQKNILCLTFTNNAVNEIKERIEDSIKNIDIDINLNISTIHKFCIDILQSNHQYYNAKLIENTDILYKNALYKYFSSNTISKKLIMHLDEEKILKILKIYIKKFGRKALNSDTIKETIKVINAENEACKPNKVHLFKRDDIIECLKMHPTTTHKKLVDNITLNDFEKTFFTTKDEPRKNPLNKKFQENYPELTKNFFDEQNYQIDLKEYKSTLELLDLNKQLIIFINKIIKLYYDELGNNITYDDAINDCLALLSDDPDMLALLDCRIDHILVDECQDNSTKQWEIIKIIIDEIIISHEDHKSFLIVGDIKQSICQFQGANPQYWHIMQAHFKNLLQDNFKILYLNKSFRSDQRILYYIDLVFNNLISHLETEEEVIKHISSSDDEGIVEKKKFSSQSEMIDEIIIKIKDLIENDDFSPNDIMIIIRHRSDFDLELVKAFNINNILVFHSDDCKLISQNIIKFLINIGKYILYNDNETLYSAVKFIIPNLDEICINRKNNSLLDELIDIDNSDNNKFKKLKDLLPTMDLPYRVYKKICQIFDIKECIYVKKFLDTMIDFHFIYTAIDYIENNNIILDDIDSHNSVRIMTVHAAKGLQAPVVFVCDSHSVPRIKDVLLPNEHGVLIFPCIENNYIKKIKKINKEILYNEYIRLLYVAMTRAKNRLYIYGYERIEEKSWFSLIEGLL
ncbi:MAG: UvrD-helicase domain-containing protein [Anaplasmataceae bacterium]|nr:UvrD-helicase domain-containing protein [Anaplasmataceae bacterium]